MSQSVLMITNKGDELNTIKSHITEVFYESNLVVVSDPGSIEQILEDTSLELIILDSELGTEALYKNLSAVKTPRFIDIPLCCLIYPETSEPLKSELIQRGVDLFLNEPDGKTELVAKLQFVRRFREMADKTINEKLKLRISNLENLITEQKNEFTLEKQAQIATMNLLEDLSDEIKARKIIEERLRVRERELEAANKNKDQLFTIISHDLRSPFQSLFSYLEIFVSEVDQLSNEQISEYSKNIYDISRNVLSLVQNLFSWALLQKGKIEYTPSKINLSHHLRKIGDLFRASIVEKKIKFSVNLEENVTLSADPNIIEIVARNLLSNAIKFTNEEGIVELKLSRSKNSAVIEVEDNGIGMESEDIDRLFNADDYYSTRGTLNEKGFGFGISLCVQLASLHHGTFDLESRKGKGTLCRFTIPLTPD